jgi:excinuclease ABC subunit C
MRDSSGRIIYVGKAKVLPKRVSSYFRDKPPSPRVGLMVSQVEAFGFMVTANEKEALILENTLIKRHRPKFNVVLRDDKTYPSLRLSVSDPFPRLEIVRRPARDGSVIFGPFPSATSLRETLKMVNRLFPLRKCARADVKKIDRPCLNFQIGQCAAPCRPDYPPERYKLLTDQVRLFFQGRQNELTRRLEADMRAAAARYDFEAAAALRDRLHDVRKTLERQVVALSSGGDLDVWALERQDDFGQAVVLAVRGGVVTGGRPLSAEGVAGTGPEAILSLIGQYYGESEPVPDEIIMPSLPPGPETALMAEWLAGLRGRPVKLATPSRDGERLRLLEMASENAKATLEERLERLARTRGSLAEIMARLALPVIPRRLECFDLAHVQGEAAVAGMVVMVEGEFKKSQYRKFRIAEAKGGDDYAGLREVIRRRFRPDRDWPAPDLLLVDGGRGQIAAALAAFDDLGLKPPPLAGIAKERGSVGADRIFTPGRVNPADLKPGSAGLMLLMRLRDEAHRFCRSYHHALRKRESLSSAFEGVKGLGPARLKALSLKYPAPEDLLAASDQELQKLTRLGAAGLAERRRPAGSRASKRAAPFGPDAEAPDRLPAPSCGLAEGSPSAAAAGGDGPGLSAGGVDGESEEDPCYGDGDDEAGFEDGDEDGYAAEVDAADGEGEGQAAGASSAGDPGGGTGRGGPA